MASTTMDEGTSKVLRSLENTPFASSSLKQLSGGTANYIYHATLKSPLQNGTTEVLVKHGEGYVKDSPGFKLTVLRCRVEEECLKLLSNLPVVSEIDASPVDGYKYIVKTPKAFYFDERNNTQIQEYLAQGTDLKTWSTQQPNLRQIAAKNQEIQQLKHTINFGWLLQRIAQFPAVLEEAKDIFEEVKKMAAAELEEDGRVQVIHGDFWSGNILLPASLVEGVSSKIPVFVVDWEMAQLGVPSLDIGQMIAELYELWLYKSIDAGLWIIQGLVAAYGISGEDFAFRTAIQVGAHLVCFGTSVQGWGTPGQVESVARTGRDLIVNAWKKERAWFEGGDLACLFS